MRHSLAKGGVRTFDCRYLSTGEGLLGKVGDLFICCVQYLLFDGVTGIHGSVQLNRRCHS